MYPLAQLGDTTMERTFLTPHSNHGHTAENQGCLDTPPNYIILDDAFESQRPRLHNSHTPRRPGAPSRPSCTTNPVHPRYSLPPQCENLEGPQTNDSNRRYNSVQQGDTLSYYRPGPPAGAPAPSSVGSESADMMTMLQEVHANTTEIPRYRPAPIPSPSYDGTTDIEEFLVLFEKIAEHNKWPQTERAIRLSLAVSGPSKLTLAGDYQEMKRRLISQNGLTTENAMSILKTLRLRPGDNIFHFTHKLTKLVQRAFPEMATPTVERHVMRELTAMLPPSSQAAWLIKAQPPKSLEELTRIIHESNLAGERRVNQVEGAEVQELCGKMINVLQTTQADMMRQQQEATLLLVQQIADGQRQMMEALLRRPQRVRTNNEAEPKKCYNCQQPGHFARSCPKKDSSSPPKGDSEQRRLDLSGNANGQRQ